MKKLLLLLLPVLFLASCGSASRKSNENVSNSSMEINYAKGFDIQFFDEYKCAVVYSPWAPGEVLQKLYLVDNVSVEVPSDGQKVVVPVTNICISSCTHTEFLEMLDEIPSVTGMCAPELIYNQKLRDRFAAGLILPLGDAFNVNLEQLIHIQPDIFMVASYNQQDDNVRRLVRSGVNIAYNNEWTENSLLARAEWIKYVAAFYNKEALADSLFRVIEKNYLAVSGLARSVVDKPSVLTGGNFKGTWYVPGGCSYMGRLLADAGADYFYANDSTTTSIALNFETVLNNFHDADVWLNAPVSSMDALLQVDSRHNLFDAARNGNVYAFYARTLPGGGNDFWESGVAHPDLILKDVIWALHPDLLPDYEPAYIIKLN